MPGKPLFEVMLSSTFRDLEEHRKHVSSVLKQHRLHAIEMEDDTSRSDEDMIDASLAKVEASDGYVCIVGKRYGQVRICPVRNPHDLSLTELEFERAVSRGVPITVLMMEPAYPVGDEQNEFDPALRAKLQAFRERVGLPHRVTADFKNWEEFLKKVPNAIADLRGALDKRIAVDAPVAESAAGLPLRVDNVLPPTPPAFHVVKPFTQGHAFVGREKELARITDWATGAKPLLVFEAIGGMGKSMVTYRWIDRLAPAVRADWAGRLWYSFYEEGASMNDFCVHALAYIERRPPRDFVGCRTRELEPLLLRHLNEQPWLIVMDGLERVLVAYHRFDKAQLRDEEAMADPNRTGRDPNGCIQPADDHLLQALATARKSMLLVSTRNMPTVLLNSSYRPIDGVEHVRLTGLEPEDAERMMLEAGIKGQSLRMRSYLETHFECHPLMVGVVAGLVNAYVMAPGNFERWLDDPQGAGAIDLTNLDGLVAKRDHILKVAYEALAPDARKLLGVLAFFSQGVVGEVLVELNPRRPTRPKEVKKPTPASEQGDIDLIRLRRRSGAEKSSSLKAELERRITARSAELRNRFDQQIEAHQQYEVTLAQWRSSPELRAADAWLGKAIAELQWRGLVITDRLTARYDLHPMVRGFVRHTLRGDESAITGRAVADYAQSRSKANYDKAASLAEVASGIEIVVALSLGGHYLDAASVLLTSNLDLALTDLELHSEALALLQPFFSQGWDNLPDRAPDSKKGELASAAGWAFSQLGDLQRSEKLIRLSITRGIVDKDLYAVASRIRLYSFLTEEMGSLFRRSKLLDLYRRIAETLSDSKLVTSEDVSRAVLDFLRGETVSARRAVDSLKAAIESGGLVNEGDQSTVLAVDLVLLERSQKLTDTDLEAGLTKARSWGDRFRIRQLLRLRGNFMQSKGNHQSATDAFEQSIALARQVFIPADSSEAEYAISLAALGQRDVASQIAARLSATDEAPHVQLAKLHLALDDRMEARRHAIAGYRKAWADGPPYSFHWDLEDCRGVLKTLSEPEPKLPPFDPAKVEPFDFEPDLYRLIEKEKAEMEQRKQLDAERNPKPPSA